MLVVRRSFPLFPAIKRTSSLERGRGGEGEGPQMSPLCSFRPTSYVNLAYAAVSKTIDYTVAFSER